ncbi:MAG TPA: alpha-L-rhamnosidase [Candidatus Dormibacteraeota bacterium]|nr:alpha-L-rhamnosidase [Candidatus Dormibacteraeota bacterium]
MFKKEKRQGTLQYLMRSDITDRMEDDHRVRKYIIPKRILWKTNQEEAYVVNEKCLLEKRSGQITLNTGNACRMNNNGAQASLLIDFGMELHGGIEILSWNGGDGKRTRLRVRFGESAMEAMSELGENNSTNDHAIRDQETEVSFMGMSEVGNTGFRFVRIDLLDENSYVELKSIRAIFTYKDVKYKGSFRSNDELINQIWETGAYTVHLNMQNYLWDGIKRDRLVWIGDMHPETSTIQRVFGYDASVPKSLDLIRDETSLPGWMNAIPSYSMWWIIIHKDWYLQNGDFKYLKEQKDYLLSLLSYLKEYIFKDGTNTIPNPFIDWPSTGNKAAVDAGVHSLLILAMSAGSELCKELGEIDASETYAGVVETLRKHIPDHGNNKQAAALMVLSGLVDETEINRDILSVGGAKRISSFLGYYVLQARARAGDIKGSLDCIRDYWGGMLSLGATTFWEDFNIEWLENAAPIDEFPVGDQIDVHGTYGDHCYVKYRHSLCHGWASGPTAWLSEYVLGIKVLEAGCLTIEVKPQLGDLKWAEGSYPTPFGEVFVSHKLKKDESIQSYIQAPKKVNIICSTNAVVEVTN